MNNQKQKQPNYTGESSSMPAPNFGKYSLVCGICGLICLFFLFPDGMYLGFFSGSIGLACGIIGFREKTAPPSPLPGVLLCLFCIALSLLVFTSLLFLYSSLNDPVLGQLISDQFIRLMEESGIPLQLFTELMAQ